MKPEPIAVPGDPRARELAALFRICRADASITKEMMEFAMEKRAQRLGLETDGPAALFLYAEMCSAAKSLPDDIHALARLAGVKLRRVH